MNQTGRKDSLINSENDVVQTIKWCGHPKKCFKKYEVKRK